MTPSLMPTGLDAQHLLDPSSMSVVIVIVQSSNLPEHDVPPSTPHVQYIVKRKT